MDVSTLLIWLAIPAFLVAIVAEFVYLKLHRKSYDYRDSAASIASGLGYQLLNIPWALVQLAIFAWLSSLVPWRIEGWAAWVIALIGVDFAYYWHHRAHHEIRVFWSVHVVHHSSESFNLTTALRTPWIVVTAMPFLAPLALFGIDGKIIAASYGINLLYQFGIHTEVINRLWAPIEFVFNTPSHHRVHHGTNDEYLDRNYGGVLIIWDRMFGTFEPERERVIYGLTKNVNTYNVAKINAHEILAIWKDVKKARTLWDKLGHLFRGPGWQPSATQANVPPSPCDQFGRAGVRWELARPALAVRDYGVTLRRHKLHVEADIDLSDDFPDGAMESLESNGADAAGHSARGHGDVDDARTHGDVQVSNSLRDELRLEGDGFGLSTPGFELKVRLGVDQVTEIFRQRCPGSRLGNRG